MIELPDVNPMLLRAASGDASAWAALMADHRQRLKRIIRVHLDPRLCGLVDPSDVIQDTFAELHHRLPEYLQSPTLPFFIWLRCLAGDKLARLHRHHLGVLARDARRTIHAGQGMMPDASSVVLSGMLLDGKADVLDHAIRAERRLRVGAVLDELSCDDREVLVLRHFEDLTAAESGAVLGVSEAASRKRYLRALERFTKALRGQPGGLAGFLS